MALEQLECPNCGSATLESNLDGTLTCSFCGNRYAAPEGVLCPSCGQVNDEEAGYCQQCGYDLIRECIACGAGNPYDAERCQTCGRSLTALETMVERIQEGTAGRLDRRMREAGDVKAREEASSQRRLEEMWVKEHQRQQTIAEGQVEQRRQEQLLMRVAFIGLIIVVLIFILVFVFINASGGEAEPSGLLIGLSAYA